MTQISVSFTGGVGVIASQVFQRSRSFIRTLDYNRGFFLHTLSSTICSM